MNSVSGAGILQIPGVWRENYQPSAQNQNLTIQCTFCLHQCLCSLNSNNNKKAGGGGRKWRSDINQQLLDKSHHENWITVSWVWLAGPHRGGQIARILPELDAEVASFQDACSMVCISQVPPLWDEPRLWWENFSLLLETSGRHNTNIYA